MENLVKEYKKDNTERVSNFFSNVGISQVIIFGVIMFILIAFSKSENKDPRYNYVIYAILIGIILVLYFKSSDKKNLIPMELAAKIAQEKLNEMVREGKRFPYDSKVYVNPQGHLKYKDDMIEGNSGPVAWDIGFVELVHGTQYKREGVISLHPYEGIVTGIDFRPLGYTGRESRDRDIIPVGVVEGKMKTTDFGKPSHM